MILLWLLACTPAPEPPPGVDPVLLPDEIDPPIAPSPPITPSPSPGGSASNGAATPTTNPTTPQGPTAPDEPKTSLTRAALKGAGVVGVVAVLGGLTYYALRPEESAS